MSGVRDLLESYVGDGTVPGAVGLVAWGGVVEVEAVGAARDGVPMPRSNLPRRVADEADHGAGDDREPPDGRPAGSDHALPEGQGWGFGGSVDVEPLGPWNVAGRYGWIGGTGTIARTWRR